MERITIANARKILGKKYEDLPDGKIEDILNFLYKMAEIELEQFSALTKAYKETHYNVDAFQSPIIIGKVSIEVDKCLKKYKASSWAYITAYNPMSARLSAAENEKRNRALRRDLKKYKILDGIGVNPNGEWEGEKSFLVIRIKKDAAKLLAKKYKQKAIVIGEYGSPAELLITL